MTDDTSRPIVEDLRTRKAELLQALWEVAAKVAKSDRQSPLTDLVRLRADIEAIDFTISMFLSEKPLAFSEIATKIT